ncbi:hypothetical protein CR513_47148, partial [Mucuna pruriens]
MAYILKYVNDLPLAIKVLGSFLFHNDVSQWRSSLARMKEYHGCKSLIISEDHFIRMHDLLIKLGTSIVCEKSPKDKKMEQIMGLQRSP